MAPRCGGAANSNSAYTVICVGSCLSPGLHFLPLRAAFAPTGAFMVRRIYFHSPAPVQGSFACLSITAASQQMQCQPTMPRRDARWLQAKAVRIHGEVIHAHGQYAILIMGRLDHIAH